MRWIFRTILALLILGLLIIGALLSIPAERIAALAADRLEQATGRPVQITGGIRPSFTPYLGVRVANVQIGNPDWVTDGPMLTAEALNLGVSWQALLAGRIQLEQARLETARLVLVRAADGRESWRFEDAEEVSDTGTDTSTGTEDSGGGGILASLGFDAAMLHDASLLYRDLGTGQEFRADALDLTLRLPEAGGAASVEASGRVNGSDLTLEASVAGIAALLDGAVQSVTVHLGWDGGDLSFDGRAGLAPAAEGELRFAARDLGPLMAVAGQAAPVLPQGLGRERIELAGNVVLASEGSLHLRGGDILLDDHRFEADLDMLPGDERWMLNGALIGGDVDLSAITGGETQSGASSGGASSTSAGSGWSRDRIDVSGLFAMDAELSVALERLDLGLAVLDGVDLRTNLDRGRLVLGLDRIGAYGGTLSGEVVVNGRGGLSSRVNLAFRGVALTPLLSQLAGYDRLDGRGDIALNVLGVGDDMNSLMHSLDGSGSVTFGQGAILGFDLAGMIRNFDSSYRGEGARTVYDSLVASFTITDGVLRNEDLALAAPWGRVTGAGSTDIGAQNVDYRVIPAVMQDDDGSGGLRVPILITGPWADLSFRPDLAYIAEQELAEQRERLEAAARERLQAEQDALEQRLRDQARDALGVDVENGQGGEGIEDALEDRLRDQAEEQLRRIFD
ncbi:AsmA family protein [Rhodophyticola sp. CCM32]|uniref:AsmA family protein n=1 Tax=Rhodophyticola sp. CCM32 TaxID=2916397 RepID=UPI00107F4A7F|nr:AsmA family protein [Rhodophyticola sp. CCM32]QBY01037.1 AsmA family protein [Rhodophyticola sp. CCM32]